LVFQGPSIPKVSRKFIHEFLGNFALTQTRERHYHLGAIYAQNISNAAQVNIHYHLSYLHETDYQAQDGAHGL